VSAASGELKATIARIPRDSVPPDTVRLARFLLGKVLVREIRGSIAVGRIVETEAYLPNDPACHAFRGMTPRNRSLFLAHGHSYVYLCYGTSYMLNVSSEAAGIGAGVLLRALEPLQGIDHMQRNAGGAKLIHLARGPGRLANALKVDRRHDGLDIFSAKELWIGTDGHSGGKVGQSVRIGITKAADQPLRYFIAGSRHLSGSRKLNNLEKPACASS
jgi:DNA-3-methyladenine glycosylase